MLEEGAAIGNEVDRQVLIEKVTSGRPRGDEGSSWDFEGRAFQAAGTVLAKALSQKPAWKKASMARAENRGGGGGDGPRGNSDQWGQTGVDQSHPVRVQGGQP